MRPAHWKLWPRQHARVAAFADSTGRADVYAYAESLITPALLELDTEGLSYVEAARLQREAADHAIAALPAPANTLELKDDHATSSAESVGSVIELRSRFRAVRRKLTPAQSQVADCMLRLGTTKSQEVAEVLGISATTVRRHQQAIRQAASKATGFGHCAAGVCHPS